MGRPLRATPDPSREARTSTGPDSSKIGTTDPPGFPGQRSRGSSQCPPGGMYHVPTTESYGLQIHGKQS